MNPSCNLFIVGSTGAGKTSIGRRLAAHYGLCFVDLDQEIEQHCGVSVTTVFEIEGEAGFRQRESALLDECSRRQGVVLATGAGAVLDPRNRQCLTERGYVIWLQASIEQQLERLAHDTRRPLLAGEDRRAKLEAMAQARAPLYRELADLAIPGEHEGVSTASTRSIALIDQHWQRQHVAASELTHDHRD
ncbi:shikimate kinase [Dyella tabacisoli]|uniref:Shikimate kinase n=1 Tax=Dyella tabacisoli TaxID=2282381 RepID=A0A369UPW1_9GAMM|nr:shikimate kinase [Dyella tabacisoli]RDD82686.1 shikimate kinase [Dyella tabacisoli]